MLRRALHSLLLTLLLVATLSRAASSGLAQNSCSFVLGFQRLHDQLPEIVGTCLENEQHDPGTGDAHQRTSGGLLAWHKAENQTTFTNGTTTWVSGPDGAAVTTVTGPTRATPPASSGKAWGIAWSGLEYVSNPADGPELDLTPAAAKFFADRGVRLFRLAFNWSVLQPTLNGPLDPTYLGRLKHAAQVASDAGGKVVLDPHNYARYRGNLIGSSAVPNSAFTDFWRRLATEFKGNPGVWAYGLMNEPYNTGGLWTKPNGAAQAGIDGVRAVDREMLILVLRRCLGRGR